MPNAKTAFEVYEDGAVEPLTKDFNLWLNAFRTRSRRLNPPLRLRLVAAAAAITALVFLIHQCTVLLGSQIRAAPSSRRLSNNPTNCRGTNGTGNAATQSGQDSRDHRGRSASHESGGHTGVTGGERRRGVPPDYVFPPPYGANSARGRRRSPQGGDSVPHEQREAGAVGGERRPRSEPVDEPSSPSESRDSRQTGDRSAPAADHPYGPPPPYEPPDSWEYPLGIFLGPPPPYEPREVEEGGTRRRHRNEPPRSQHEMRPPHAPSGARPVQRAGHLRFPFLRINNRQAKEELNAVLSFVADFRRPHYGYQEGLFTVRFGGISFRIRVVERQHSPGWPTRTNLENIENDLQMHLLGMQDAFVRNADAGFSREKVSFTTVVDGNVLGDVCMFIEAERIVRGSSGP